MLDPTIERIRTDPNDQRLRSVRNRLGSTSTVTMLIVCHGFIALIAFDKPFLARPIGTGVTTPGIPIGVAVIVFTVPIVGCYVRRANSEFDTLTARMLNKSVR